jgi:hypothetical protein
MTLGELVLLGKPHVKDYSKVDSRTLLNEGAKSHEALKYIRAALELQLSSLDKEFKASGLSEATVQIAQRVNETVRDFRMFAREVAAIEREVLRRMSHNVTNWKFGLLHIGILRDDYGLREEACKALRNIFGSIPWKRDWFHKERRDGINSLTNLLLAKELNKHRHLDLPSTIERMMDNGFAYLHCAYERDFMDEMDKVSSRPFESQLEVDELIPDTSRMDSVDDRIHLDRLEIRLREAAMKQDHPVDREIILGCADVLGDRHLLNSGDRAIRAPLVENVACKTGFSPQGVRGRLIRGTTLPVLKKVLRFEPVEEK